MRLFLAINLPDDLKKQLFELSRGLKGFGKIKLVEEENIHLTLKFLGDSEPKPIIKALDGIEFQPFDISLKGLGVFPNTNYIKVVWVGCDKGFHETIQLHDAIEGSLNFPKYKDFHPHATIARVKFPKFKNSLLQFIEDASAKEFGSFKVKSFELMKSELTRDGPKYDVVKKFLL